MRNGKKYTVIDLFAGAGGLSVGFENSGFKSLLALDFDKDSCLTYQKNFSDTKVICGDILHISNDQLKKMVIDKVDVIIGGPPCQGFSALGKRIQTDPRNQLWREYLRIVKIFKPRIWVIENVPEILKSQEFLEIKILANELGYKIDSKVLNAADYGVPQRRQRAVIVAVLKSKFVYPEETHVNVNKKDLFNTHKSNWVTVKDAFKGLSAKPDEKNLHTSRKATALSIERYRSIPPGGNRFNLPKNLQPNCWLNKPTGSTDVFGRLWWNQPSLTIRTEFYKPEKGRYLHPSENRPITLREGARLQTFPDTFEFVGSQTSVGRQIGNAVPCLLAQKIAESVKEYLDENY